MVHFVFLEQSSWIEVFIDILLSMYTKKQHDIRSIVKKIYHQIVPYVNENALKLMLQVKGILVIGFVIFIYGNFRQLERKMKVRMKKNWIMTKKKRI